MSEMTKKNLEIIKSCVWCNKEFIAQKTTTKYCSHNCNSQAYKAQKREEKIRKQKADNLLSINTPYLEKLNTKDFLKVNEVADLLGLCKQSIYNLIQSGQLPASRISSRLTLIKRKDIDEMFEKGKNRIIPNQAGAREVSTTFYSISEIEEFYNIGTTWAYKIIRDNNIVKIVKKGKTYYSKKDFDNYFKRKGRINHEDITDWITVPDICSEFSMTSSAVYTFVSRHDIPKTKKGRTALYSKRHILIAKGGKAPSEIPYYTVQEAMQKFNISQDGLYSLIKRNNLAKIKAGKYIKIPKDELDRIFSPTNTD